MNRKSFIQLAAGLSAQVLLRRLGINSKTHLLTLSFDDGFRKSFFRIAEMHREYGLKACLNVIALGDVPGRVNDPYIPQEILGNMDDWNRLKSEGHEVMPHSWDHRNLTLLPLDESKKDLDNCFDFFEKNLEGYNAATTVYNFAYNASNEALDAHALERVKAVRTGGWLVCKDTHFNEWPVTVTRPRLGCYSYGPGICDESIEKEMKDFLSARGGWLILNLHGLDTEGWGPVSSRYLDQLLKKLSRLDFLQLMPTGEVLRAV